MTIKNQIYYSEELKTNDHIEKKKDRDQRRKPRKIFNLRREDIFSYIVVRYNETSDPIYSEELGKYYNLSVKQIDGYILKLENIGLVERPKNTCPMPIYPTSEGREKYYKNLLKLFPRNVQPKIKQLVSI